MVQDLEEDVIYHLSLGSGSYDLRHMFVIAGDINLDIHANCARPALPLGRL